VCFFSSRRRHKRSKRDWSSDVCSSDLKYLKKENPNILHINALTSGNVAKCAEDLNIPVVWHIREFMEEDLGIDFVNPKNALKVRSEERRVGKECRCLSG